LTFTYLEVSKNKKLKIMKKVLIILLIMSITWCFNLQQVNAQSFSSKTSNNPALEGVLEEIENKKTELIDYEKLLTQQVNNDEEFKAKYPRKVKRIQCMKKRALKFIKRAENVEPKKTALLFKRSWCASISRQINLVGPPTKNKNIY